MHLVHAVQMSWSLPVSQLNVRIHDAGGVVQGSWVRADKLGSGQASTMLG